MNAVIRSKISNTDDAAIDRSFQMHINAVLLKLDSRLENITDPMLKKIEATMGKHGIFDATFQQVLLIASTVSPQLLGSLREIRGVHAKLFSDLQAAVGGYIKTCQAEKKDLNEQIEALKTAALQGNPTYSSYKTLISLYIK